MTNPQQILFSILKNYNYFLSDQDKTRIPTLTTIIQHSFGSLSHGNERRKRNKRNQDWKRSKTLIVAEDMILYMQACVLSHFS